MTVQFSVYAGWDERRLEVFLGSFERPYKPDVGMVFSFLWTARDGQKDYVEAEVFQVVDYMDGADDGHPGTLRVFVRPRDGAMQQHNWEALAARSESVPKT